VNALAIQPDGKFIIGGDFLSHNSDANAGDRLARLGGELWVTWESGDASNKNLLIPLNDDTTEEPTEGVQLVPAIVSGNSIVSDFAFPSSPSPNRSLNIIDNDLTISLVSGSGSVSGAATLTAKLTKNGLGLNNKTVNFQ
jgi:hypothetical protein